MTDNEIAKIREKISCPQFGDANYGEWGILTLNQRKTIYRLLEEINRQKAKIKALQMDNQQLQNDIVNANMNADNALAEIERLKTLNSKLEAEVFMQRENQAIHTEPEDENWFEPLKTVDELKAEAIKEYHKKVRHRLLDKGFYPAIVKCVLDEVEEEMVGDGNEKM